MISRFKREIQLARKIGHPHVCRVFDLARHPADGSSPNPALFLTMEFLEGETLAERMDREGRIAPAEALRLLAQMADALDAAHRAGIIHRDFKPGNVMLVPGDRGAVVTDFGLARSVEFAGDTTATASGQLVGTIDYMAPELFTGEPATPASDQYALALVAYKMVSGKLPFQSDSPLAGVVRRAGQKPPSVREPWDHAFARALDPDPTHRFATCTAFVDALSGRSQSVTLNLPRLSRRKWAAVIAAALVLVAAPFAWRAWQRARSRPSPEAENFYEQGVADLHAGAYFAASKALIEAINLSPHFTLAHARLAEAWNALDLSEKATQEMLIVRRQDLSALSRLEKLQVDAVDFTITREFSKSEAKYEEILKTAADNRSARYVDLGRAYEQSAKIDKAIEAYRKAAEGPTRSAAAWLRLGAIYGRSPDNSSSASRTSQAFEEAARMYQLSNNLEGLTELDLQWGIVENRRGHLAEGATHLQNALDASRRAGNLAQEIRVALQLASNAYLRGDSGAAERYAAEALDRAQASGMENQASSGFVTLGNAYLAKRVWDGAERAFLRGLELARRGGSPRLVALSMLSLASVHSQQKQPDKVAAEAQTALEYFQSNHWSSETFNCLLLLARSQRDRGDYNAALAASQRMLQTAEANDDRGQKAIAHELLGSISAEEENYPEAAAHQQENLKLTMDPSRIGYAQVVLGDTFRVLGRLNESQRLFDEAEKNSERFPALRVPLLRARADLALAHGRNPEAIVIARRALALNADQSELVSAELNGIIASALTRSGNPREAVRYAKQSLDATRRITSVYSSLEANTVLLFALVETGDHAGAREVYDAIVRGLDTHPETRWRILALMSRIEPLYQTQAQNALEALRQKWGDDAFQRYTERKDIQNVFRPLSQLQSAKNRQR